MRMFQIALALAGSGAALATPAAPPDTNAMHEEMLDEIKLDFRATADITGRRAMRPAVEAALRRVPRHEFVDKRFERQAYLNRPLMIGHGQTISQPFIVALMTELLDLAPHNRVLEIGTGSGYQAAILAELAAEVYSIEIIEALSIAARARLARLGYERIQVRTGDGNLGWPEAAPFDAIIVTAGGQIPPALIAQLKPGGRMVIPVEIAAGMQELQVITKDAQGAVRIASNLPVRFVPLTGDNRSE